MSKKVDLTGQRFGRLVVVGDSGERKNRKILWECKCDCGATKNISGNKLKSGGTKSCGCFKRENKSKDLTGQRFGLLTAIEPTTIRIGGNIVWKCVCDCGGVNFVTSKNLLQGIVKSCKCIKSIILMTTKTIRNTSGCIGVSWRKKTNKWLARIKYQHKEYHLGLFPTLEEAIAARQKAEEEILKGEFNIERTKHSEPDSDSTVETWDDLPY